MVGGGPAGLAAAITLAAKGIAVVVVEKGSWTLDKVCGEGILPTGVDFLQRFGVLPRLQAGMFRPFQGIRYRDHKGLLVEADFLEGRGLGVRRVALSRALFESVRDNPLVELLPHTRLLDFSQDVRGVEATLATGSSSQRRETFAFLIGADGRSSRVRRLAGLSGQPPGRQQRWGARQHFGIAPWSPYVEVWWQRGIEAYITPSGPKQVEIALLWDRAQFSPERKSGISAFLSPFPTLAARIQQATPLSLFRGLGPLAVASTSPISGRIVLIGDAFLYLDGVTGEGISLAFTQSELLAQYLPSHLEPVQISHESLQPLAEALTQSTSAYLRMTHLALCLTRHPSLRTLSLRALSRSPRFFQHFLEATMGRKGLWKLPFYCHPTIGMGDAEPTTTALDVNSTHQIRTILSSS